MSSALLSESTNRETNVVEDKVETPYIGQVRFHSQTKTGSKLRLFVVDSLSSLAQAYCPQTHYTSDFTPNDWLHSKCCKNNLLKICLTWNLTRFGSEGVQLPSGREVRYNTRKHSHLPSITACQVSFPSNGSFWRWKNMRTAHGKYPGPPSSFWLVFILFRNILFLFSFHRISTNVGENRKRFKGTLWGLYHWQHKIEAVMESSSQEKASRRSTMLFSDVLTSSHCYR